MIMKTYLLAAAVVALTAVSASASTTTIDFESFAFGTDISGVDVGGVAFSAGGAAVTVDGFLGNRGIIPRPLGPNPFRADFTAGNVVGVSVDIGDLGADADDIFLNAFDMFGSLLASDTFTIPAGVGGYFNLGVMASNISYVTFGGVGFNDDNNVFADNFSFASAAVIPLPAGGILLLGALGMMAAARRRKAKS